MRRYTWNDKVVQGRKRVASPLGIRTGSKKNRSRGARLHGAQNAQHTVGNAADTSVQEDSRGKTILACWSAFVRQLDIAIDRELESHDTERERKRTSFTEPEYTCSLFIACTSCSTMKVGISCLNTVKVSCHAGKIASRKFRRCQVPS